MLGLLAGMAVSLALPVVAVSVAEQDFPSKPIRIIAPFLPTSRSWCWSARTSRAAGRPFQFARVLYRTDRYQQVVSSRRDEGRRTPSSARQMEEVGEPMVRRRAANSGATS